MTFRQKLLALVIVEYATYFGLGLLVGWGIFH